MYHDDLGAATAAHTAFANRPCLVAAELDNTIVTKRGINVVHLLLCTNPEALMCRPQLDVS